MRTQRREKWLRTVGDILVSFSCMETADALEMEKRVYSTAQCWQFLHGFKREAHIVSSNIMLIHLCLQCM